MPIQILGQKVKNFLDKPAPNFLQKPTQAIQGATQKFEQSPVGRVVTAPKRAGQAIGGGLATGIGRIGSAIKHYATDPQARREDIVEPVKAKLQQPKVFAQRVGEAAATPYTQKRFEETQEQLNKQADLYRNRAIEASQAGDKETADRFFQAAREVRGRVQESASQRIGEMEEGKQELIKSGVDTAALATMAYAPGSALKGGAIGGGIRSALSDDPKSLVEGFGQGMATGAVAGTFKPVITGVVGGIKLLTDNPIAQDILSRTAAGALTTIQSRLGYKLAGMERKPIHDITAFTIGMLLGGGKGTEEDWKNLKKELTTFGLTNKEADQAREIIEKAASRLQWEVKYREMQTGQYVPKVVLKRQTTIDGIGRDIDRLVSRKEVIREGGKVLSEGQEKMMLKKFTQGGYVRLGFNKEPKFEAPYQQGDLSKLNREIDRLIGWDTSSGNWKKDYYLRQDTIKAYLNDPSAPADFKAKLSNLVDQVDRAKTERAVPGSVETSKMVDEKTGKLIGEQRGFLDSIRKDPVQTGDKFQKNIKDLEQTYIPQANSKAMDWANNKIGKEGLDKSIDWVRNLKLQDLEKQGDKAGAIAVQAIKRAEAAGDTERAIQLADEFDSMFRGGGRLVQSASMWSNLSPNAMIRHAEKTFEEANKRMTAFHKVEVTPELEQKITEGMKKAASATNESDRLAAVLEVKTIIARKIPPSLVEWVDAYRYNNMLSGPGTHMREGWGDLIAAYITRPATMFYRGGIDFIKSTLFGTERQHYISDVPTYYKGAINGFTSGVEGIKQAMAGEVKTGRVAQETGVADEFQVMRAVQTERTPKAITFFSRIMDSIERFFAAQISSGEYAVQLKRGASEQVARQKADEIANYALFKNVIDPTNETGQGLVLSGIDNATKLIYDARNAPVIGPVVSAFIPFVSTSMNIFKQQIEYSPLGFATLAGAAEKDEQLSKALLGSTVTLLAAKMAMDGEVTWNVPRGEEEKELFYASGKRPFSAKIGDHWVPFQFLGIFGTAFALPAAVHHYHTQSKTAITDDQSTKLSKTLQAIFEYYNHETFLSGLNALTEVISGEASPEEAVGFASMQMIPFGSLMAFVSNVLDPVYRKADGFKETVMRHIPGLSQELAPYLDPEGREAKRHWSYYLLPYVLGEDQPEYSQRLNQLQQIQQAQEVPAWFKRELSDIQERIQDIHRNQDMSKDERIKRLEREGEKMKQLRERYETLIPKAREVMQQPRVGEPIAPVRQQESPPANLEPTLAPEVRGRLVI